MREKQLELFDFFNEPNYLILSEVFPDSESDEIEYKSAQGGFPTDFWKTYSAFANSKGGIIVLGVKEKKNTFIVEGLDQELLLKYQKDFWNTINNKSGVSLNLVSNDDVKVYTLEGQKVLAFKIPAATRTQKPVYLTTNPFQNTYKRNY